MFLSALTLRRLGLAAKPLIACPNHLLEQIARDGKRLFPGANILMVAKDDLTRERRKRFAARCATGDWDVVVITHSAFTALAVHPDTEAAWLAPRSSCTARPPWPSARTSIGPAAPSSRSPSRPTGWRPASASCWSTAPTMG